MPREPPKSWLRSGGNRTQSVCRILYLFEEPVPRKASNLVNHEVLLDWRTEVPFQEEAARVMANAQRSDWITHSKSAILN